MSDIPNYDTPITFEQGNILTYNPETREPIHVVSQIENLLKGDGELVGTIYVINQKSNFADSTLADLVDSLKNIIASTDLPVHLVLTHDEGVNLPKILTVAYNKTALSELNAISRNNNGSISIVTNNALGKMAGGIANNVLPIKIYSSVEEAMNTIKKNALNAEF